MNADRGEVVLKGGRANTGNIVRIGNEVARPAYPQTASVEHFLHYLGGAGASFVPRPLGFDEQGRQRLSYIEGVAPTPPYPTWAFDEGLLTAVASLQRRLHQLARGYTPPADAEWATSAGDYFPTDALNSGPSSNRDVIVCHNDLGMTNVIVDQSRRLVGVIDFDYSRPVDRLFDIAIAVRHWAPFGDLDIADSPVLDRVARFGLFCDVHELDFAERRRVVALAAAFLVQARRNINALAEAGRIGFQTLLEEGYEATNRATVAWLDEHAEILART